MNNIVTNTFQLHALLTFIANNDVLAYDIETTGLSVRNDKIIGLAIANSKTGYYIPIYGWNKSTETLDKVGLPLDSISQLLQNLATKKLLTFNGAFDLPFTKNFLGVNLLPNLYADIMLAAHTADENRRSYALKEIAADMYGEAAKDEQADMLASIKANGGTAKEYFKADLQAMAIYAIKDAVLTAKLWQDLQPILQQDGVLDFFLHDEVMPLYRTVTIPMEQHGIAVDLPYMQATLQEISADIDKLEENIQAAIAPHLGIFEQWFLRKDFPYTRSGSFLQAAIKFYGGDLPKTSSGAYSVAAKNVEALPESLLKWFLQGHYELPEADIVAIQKQLWADQGAKYMFNLNSRHHLKKLFFDTLKEKTLNKTPTGQNQADEEFVASMTGKYPWASDLLTYYKLVKLKGTYIERFINEQENGRFYPRFLQHRTVSGRMSGDLQQLPRPFEKKDLDEGKVHPLIFEYTNRIRSFFIADPGKIIIDDDWESAEPRVFAAISQENGIKDIFKNGEDFYSKIALLVEDLKDVSAHKNAPNYLGKVDKTKRQNAKVYALGVPYSMGAYKLQFELNIPIEEAEMLVKRYLNAFPNLTAWMKETNQKVITEGQVRTKFGRLRRMPKAVEIYKKYDKIILDDLELWKALHEMPGVYARAKVDRRELKNYMANGANFQIQGLVASMLNRACINIAKEFKQDNLDAVIIATIHDEIVVQSSLLHKDLAAKIIQKCMEDICTLDVPMVAIPSFGYNLRDSKG